MESINHSEKSLETKVKNMIPIFNSSINFKNETRTTVDYAFTAAWDSIYKCLFSVSTGNFLNLVHLSNSMLMVSGITKNGIKNDVARDLLGEKDTLSSTSEITEVRITPSGKVVTVTW